MNKHYLAINSVYMVCIMLLVKTDTDTNEVQLKGFSNIVYNESYNIILLIINILTAILLNALAYIDFSFDFDPLFNEKHYNSQLNPNYVKLMLIFQWILVLAVKGFSGEEPSFELLILLAVICFYFFMVLCSGQSYINRGTQKIYLCFWATNCLFSVAIMTNYVLKYTGFMFAAINISMLIVLAMITYTPLNQRLLMHNIEEIDNEEDIQLHLVSLISLLSAKNSFSAKSMLSRYSINHKLYCQINNCPFQETNDAQFKEDEEIDISKQLLKKKFAHFLRFQFQRIIRIYPDSANMKILNVISIINVEQDKLKAFTVLESILADFNLNFTCQYTAYCLEKLIKDSENNIMYEENENNDKLNEDRKLLRKSFINMLTACIYLSIDFWTILKQDQPDYKKFMKVGRKFVDLYDKINKQADKLNRENKQELELLIKYSDFLYRIVGDLEKTVSILNQVKETLSHFNQRNLEITVDSKEVIENYGIAIVVGEIVENSVLKIVNVNEEVEKLLKYKKIELIMQKMDVLLPKGLVQIILPIIEKFNTHTNDKKVDAIKLFLPLKTSDGIVIPAIIKFIYNEDVVLKKRHLIIQIHTVQDFDESLIILCDEHFMICGLNFKAKEFLQIQYTVEPVSLIDLFSDFDAVKNELFEGKEIMAKLNIEAFSTSFEDRTYSVELADYTKLIKESGLYVFKIDTTMPGNPKRITRMNPVDKTTEVIRSDTRMLKNISKKIEQVKQRARLTHTINNTYKVHVSQGVSDMNSVKKPLKNDKKYNYKGIKLCLLKNDQLYTIDEELAADDDIEEELEDEYERFQLEERNKDKQHEIAQSKDIKDKTRLLKNQRHFHEVFEHLNLKGKLSILKIAIYLFSLFIVATEGVSIYIIYKEVENHKTYLNTSYTLKMNNNNFLYIAHNIYESIMYYSFYTDERISYDQILGRTIKSNEQLINEIRTNTEYLKNIQVLDRYSYFAVSLNFFADNNKSMNLLLLHELLVSKIVQLNTALSNSSVKELLGTVNDKTYFILYNGLNTYIKTVMHLMQILDDEFNDETKAQHTLLLITIIAIPSFVSLIFTILVAAFYRVIIKKIKIVMHVFLKIPSSYINQKTVEIQSFINQTDTHYQDRYTKSDGEINNETFMVKKKFKNDVKMLPYGVLLIFQGWLVVQIIFVLISESLNKSLLKPRTSLIRDNPHIFEIEHQCLTDYVAIPAHINNIDFNLEGKTISTIFEGNFEACRSLIDNIFYHHIRSMKHRSDYYLSVAQQTFYRDTCQNTKVYSVEEYDQCQNDFKINNSSGLVFLLYEISKRVSFFKYQLENQNAKDADYITFRKSSKIISGAFLDSCKKKYSIFGRNDA